MGILHDSLYNVAGLGVLDVGLSSGEHDVIGDLTPERRKDNEHADSYRRNHRCHSRRYRLKAFLATDSRQEQRMRLRM